MLLKGEFFHKGQKVDLEDMRDLEGLGEGKQSSEHVTWEKSIFCFKKWKKILVLVL